MKILHNSIKLILPLIMMLIVLEFVGCKKFIEVDAPVTDLNKEIVYSQEATAISTLTAIYAAMSNRGSVFTGSKGLSFQSGLSADELKLLPEVSDLTMTRYYRNALSANSLNTTVGAENWVPLYQVIFYCNSAIEGLQTSNALTARTKQELIGESKFIRALCYFYLANCFGDIPLALTTDYKINASLMRTEKAGVYDQVVADLKEAQGLLSDSFLDGSLSPYTGLPERTRPTKWAATALLARVYLYMREYSNAEIASSALINNGSMFNLASLNDIFLKNSTEAIWQLQPVVSGWNTEDARIFSITSVPNNSRPVSLNEDLLNAFELNDARKSNWTKTVTFNSTSYTYAYKYKVATLNSPVTEYLMVLRLGEQYLIRAEARAQLSNISGAQTDLNVIRNRANLPNTYANDKVSLLNAIMHERRVELFTEFGHRWFDLKRTGIIDNVMSFVTPKKGGIWNSYQALYPIPLLDIERNPKLVQNPGY